MNFVPKPPGVFDTTMSAPESLSVGSLVGVITNTDTNALLNFTMQTLGSDIAALSLFRVQSCSGSVFLNQVRRCERCSPRADATVLCILCGVLL